MQQLIISTNQNNAIVAYQGRPTNVYEKVMKRVVESKSESKYKNDDTTFILWLYDNQDLGIFFLHNWFVTQLIQKEAIYENTKGRKNKRAKCKLALYGMKKTDSNYPIILQKITFNLFSYYLTTRQNKGGWFLSKASYSGVRSEFVHMHRMSGETMTKQFNIEISQFMSGMKRSIAPQNTESGESLDKGKKLMSYEVYKKLCGFLFQGEGNDYELSPVFIVLGWNLLM